MAPHGIQIEDSLLKFFKEVHSFLGLLSIFPLLLFDLLQKKCVQSPSEQGGIKFIGNVIVISTYLPHNPERMGKNIGQHSEKNDSSNLY